LILQCISCNCATCR